MRCPENLLWPMRQRGPGLVHKGMLVTCKPKQVTSISGVKLSDSLLGALSLESTRAMRYSEAQVMSQKVSELVEAVS